MKLTMPTVRMISRIPLNQRTPLEKFIYKYGQENHLQFRKDLEAIINKERQKAIRSYLFIIRGVPNKEFW